MEGIIMEVQETTLIILTTDGGFIEIPAPLGQFSVGETIPISKASQSQFNFSVHKLSLMAASFLLALVIGLTSYGYTQTFGYLNLDINPSIIISYNWFQRVINVESLNEDGEEILLDTSSLNHGNLNAAVNQLIDKSIDKGFIHSSKDNVIYISVSDRSSSIRSSKILEKLSDAILVPDNTDYAFIKGPKNNYNAIKNVPQSVIKKWIEDELVLDEEIIIESSKPLKELIKQSKQENKKESEKEKPKETDSNSSNKNNKDEDHPSNNASDNATKSDEENNEKNNNDKDKTNNGQTNENKPNDEDDEDADDEEVTDEPNGKPSEKKDNKSNNGQNETKNNNSNENNNSNSNNNKKD